MGGVLFGFQVCAFHSPVSLDHSHCLAGGHGVVRRPVAELVQSGGAKQTDFLPSSTPVMQAGRWLNEIDPGHAAKSSAVVAMHDAHGLTAAELTYFRRQLAAVNSHLSRYGATYVTDAFHTSHQADSSFRSKDGTTEVALIGLSTNVTDPKTATILAGLHTQFSQPPTGGQVYFTGDAPIQQDDITISWVAAFAHRQGT